MIYTQKSIDRLLDKHEKLIEDIEYYLREKFPKERSGDVRIEYGRIEEHINTSCHCHPEYEWVDRGELEDFVKWVKSKGDRFYPKHYTVKNEHG